MDWICSHKIEISFLSGALLLYPVLLALVLKTYVCKLFDGALLNDSIWNTNAEKNYVFATFKMRRSYLYLAAVGSNWAAKRRFKGYDFRSRVPRVLIPFCILHFWAILLVGLFVIPMIVIRIRCS